MHVLIIGGTGLISTAITNQLLARGDQVTHYNRGKSESRISRSVPTISGDRRESGAFEAQLQESGPWDVVMDMICYTPEEAESLVRAVRGRTGHLIVCSTVDVYAKPATQLPTREDAPLKGVSAYGQRKAILEGRLMEMHRRGEVPITILRPAQTYGEGRPPIHVFGGGAGVIKRLRQGRPVIVHGDGSSLWVAGHIEDVARGFVGAAGNPASFGKAYNVTGEEWLTWNQITATLARAAGAPAPQIVHIPTDLLFQALPKRAQVIAENFQFNNLFETSAARRDLGFAYTIPFEEGTKRTLAWCDARGLIDGAKPDLWQDQVIEAWQKAGTGLVAALQGLE